MNEEPVKISCIIPTVNEEAHVGRLVQWLKQCSQSDRVEVIVVDGKSDDNTLSKAKEAGAQVLTSEIRSRAHQMNLGARVAKGEILYFVHADAMPPSCCFEDVIKASDAGHLVGGFRFKFDSDKWILKFNSFMTRFNIFSFRGGDQSIFIKKDFFEKLNGYDEKYVIMEEYDLLRRVKALGIKYYLIQKDVLVSARKYDGRTWLEVNWANVKAMAQFRRGVAPEVIKRNYLKTDKDSESRFPNAVFHHLCDMRIFKISAILLALAVVFGAFGAHALKVRLTAESLAVWKTAVEYHFYHALGLMALALAFRMNFFQEKSFKWISGLMLGGLGFFSGSLYLLSTRDIHGLPVGFLGPITPIGGVLFIAAWIMAALKANVHSVGK